MRKLLLAFLSLAFFAANAQKVIYQESFESGLGVGYTYNGYFSDGGYDYFDLSGDGTDAALNASDPTGTGNFTGLDGTHCWEAQDTDDADNPNCPCSFGDSTGVGMVVIDNIDISTYNNLTVKALFGANDGSGTIGFDSRDFMNVYANIDGAGYTLIGAFNTHKDSATSNTTMFQDTDLDGRGDGTMLNWAMQDFEFPLSTTGDSLDLKIVIYVATGYSELAFDNIRVIADTINDANFVLESDTAAEGGDSVLFKVDLDFPAVQADTLWFEVNNIGGMHDTDWVEILPHLDTFSIPFAPGDSTFMMYFHAVDDNLVEGWESAFIRMISATGDFVIGTKDTFNYYIQDNDSPPDVTIAGGSETATLSEETNDSVKIRFNIFPAPAGDETLKLVVMNGAGVTATDYETTPAASADTITVTVPQDSTKFFMWVKALDDTEVEANETVTFKIAAVSGPLTVSGIDSIVVTITSTDVPPTPQYSIGTVTTLDANGSPDSNGVECYLQGIAVGNNFNAGSGGISFSLIDSTGAITLYSGSNNYGYTLTEGDELKVLGNIGFFNGLTQLYLDTIMVVSSGNAFDTTTVTSLGETEESYLIRINGVSIVDASQWTGSGSGFNVDITDGTNTFQMRIDNDCELYSQSAPTGTFDVVGMGGQYDNAAPYDAGYQILPRRASDIIPDVGGGIEDMDLGSVSIYPNPTSGKVNISYESFTNTTTTISIRDAVGRVIRSVESSSKGMVQKTMNLSSMEKGFYTVEFSNSNGSHVEKLLLK